MRSSKLSNNGDARRPWRIVNATFTAKVGKLLPLIEMVSKFPNNAKYDAKKFNALVFKVNGLNNRGPTLLVFSTGQVVIVGAKSYAQAAECLKSIIAGKMYVARKPILRNVVVHIHLNCLIDLNKLYADVTLRKYLCVFEPEIFPSMKVYIN